MDTATSKALGMDTTMAKSPIVDTATARCGYSDASFLLHRILHQKVRNVENLHGKIRAFVLVRWSDGAARCWIEGSREGEWQADGGLRCGDRMRA